MRKNISLTKLNRLLAWTMVMVWVALIFTMSSQHGDASAHLSGTITESVHTVFLRLNIAVDINTLHTIVRKSAHFLAYALLAIWTFLALTYSKRQTRNILYTLAITLLIATSDELFQTTIPGRSGQISDVLIDFLGGIGGALFVFWFTNKRLQ